MGVRAARTAPDPCRPITMPRDGRCTLTRAVSIGQEVSNRLTCELTPPPPRKGVVCGCTDQAPTPAAGHGGFTVFPGCCWGPSFRPVREEHTCLSEPCAHRRPQAHSAQACPGPTPSPDVDRDKMESRAFHRPCPVRLIRSPQSL